MTAPESLRTQAAVAAALPPLALLAVTEGLMRVAGHGHRRWAYRAGVAGAVHLRGVPIAVIASWLGHSSAAFTMATYAHSQDEALEGRRREIQMS